MATYAYPHGHLIYRKLRHNFPRIVRGEGVYLFDEDGTRYLDASGGAFVSNLGHGNPAVVEAIRQQAATLDYVSGIQFTHDSVEELAQALCAVAPRGLDKAFFLSGGSEATEAAMKLARQYWVARGHESKFKIISRMPSYHGNTLGALSVGGRRSTRIFFEPLYIDHPKIPAPICYHCPWKKNYPGCDYECARELESMLLSVNPESVAAFLVEPVLGSTGGAMAPQPEYYARAMEICRKYEVLFIADEILCGMGRTGDWFAISSYGVIPDILLAGKGLTGGCVPLSALLARHELIDAIHASGNDFLHAQTFAHHPVACAAGLATIRYLQEHRLVERCREMGKVLHGGLQKLNHHPLVGEVRGRGLLAGLEFVASKTTREPFPRQWKVAERIASAAMAQGLVVWTNTGHVDGINGDAILLAPPFIVTREHIEEMVSLLEQSCDTVAAQLNAKIQN